MDTIIAINVKVVARSHKPKDNYHHTLQFSFSSLFSGLQLYLFVFFSLLSSALFSDTTGSYFVSKKLWQIICYLLNTKQQNNNVSNYLINIMEHLAAKQTHIFSQEFMESKQERVGNNINTGLTVLCIWWMCNKSCFIDIVILSVL